MDETWSEKLVNAAIFFGAVALILFVGWNEPLSYRFKNSRELQPQDGPSTSSPTQWQSQFGGTALDRAPYKVEKGRVRYSTQFDPNDVGTATETDRRNGSRR